MRDANPTDNRMRLTLTLLLVTLFCAAWLLLDRGGAFALNVFGRGVAVTGMAAPAVCLAAVWLAAMIRPRLLYNRFAAVAVPAAVVVYVAAMTLAAPKMGDLKNPACPLPADAPRLSGANLIIISLDTLRADRVGALGCKRDTTPALDRFAVRGVVFEHAFSHAPATLSSHSTAFTGLLPDAHGAQIMTHSELPPEAITLTEILKSRGYATAGFTGGAQLSAGFGFHQGFDVYEDKHWGLADNWNMARAWLSENSDKRFFLFLHTYDIHTPYEPPPPYNRMFDPGYNGPLPDKLSLDLLKKISGGDIRASDADLEHINAQYDAGVRYADSVLDEIFDWLDSQGLLSNTVVVIMSDHGEELGERGVVGMHAHSLYNEALHVPLIVRAPGLAPARVRQRAGLVDLTPTLLELLAVPFEAERFQGASVAGLLRPGARCGGRRRVVVAEKEHAHFEEFGRHKAVFSGPWKLILRTPAPALRFVTDFLGGGIYPSQGKQLFRLDRDPGEARDLLNRNIQTARGMERLIRRAGRDNARISDGMSKKHAAVSDEDREKLKDLGYIK